MKSNLTKIILATTLLTWIGISSAFAEWATLGTGMNDKVNALTADKHGNIYAGGWFTEAGGVSANYVAKWNGSSWSALGTGMNTVVYALAVDADGNLYAGGDFTTAGDINASRVAKWDGSGWSALGTEINDTVSALVVDSNGSLYAGGAFYFNLDDVYVNSIAKWNGSVWSSVGPVFVYKQSGVDGGDVFALAANNGGEIYAGGGGTKAGGVTASKIAKWNGSAWSALGSGLNVTMSALAVDSSGNLYAGGYFTQAGGTSANYIAKWNGSTWSALGTGMDYSVYALAVDSIGNLYAGGFFYTAGGVSASKIAKWNGTAWSALGTGMDETVLSLATDSIGNLYAGGRFTTAGGISANYIAKWIPDNAEVLSYSDVGHIGNDLKFNIPCAQYHGIAYQFVMNHSPKLYDLTLWEMDIATFKQLPSATAGCLAVGDDLKFNIYAEYSGVNYAFIMNYKPDPNDQLMWSMDVSTFRKR